MGVTGIDPEVTLSDNDVFGEYTTNIAMKLVKILKKSPMEIGLEVKKRITNYELRIMNDEQDQNTGQRDQKISRESIGNRVLQDIESVNVVKPGFINIKISALGLSSRLSRVLNEKEAYGTVNPKSPALPAGRQIPNPKKILVEFAHPNTHKAFHIGHLRNITTGETIVRLLESQGNTIVRANYQGDVGMHIAKCLYGILQIPNLKSQISKKTIQEKVEFLGKAYAAGSKAFEEDANAKKEIIEINKQIYEKNTKIYPLYQETRQWSLEYFDAIYKRVGSHFDRLYFESEMYEKGVVMVNDGLKKGIFSISDGAIVLDGKKHGVDTRVFVNSLGLPTYEGKELALAALELTDHGTLDRIVHVVGPEQASFFKTTFKAEELLGMQKDQQMHLVYGWVKLKKGKMSSRLGNVVLGEWVLDEAKKKIYDILQTSKTKDKEKHQSDEIDKATYQDIAEKAAIAAVKYAFLKVATNQEISFDFDESITFDGDSGPYLLYTCARCKSVLRKADTNPKSQIPNPKLNLEEHAVVRLIYIFPEVVTEAAGSYSPNILCRYLFQLAQAFNLMYAKHKIADDENRLIITAATAQTLKNGLYLLGIETVERM